LSSRPPLVDDKSKDGTATESASKPTTTQSTQPAKPKPKPKPAPVPATKPAPKKPNGDTPTKTRAAYTARADQLCREGNRKVTAIQRRYDRLDPRSHQAGVAIHDAVREHMSVTSQLRALKPSPGDERFAQEYVNEMTTQTAVARNIEDQVSSIGATQYFYDTVVKPNTPPHHEGLAMSFGFHVCGGLFSTR
jgi:hypothetical protein